MTRKEDLALVRQIIGVDPLDFARRAGGQLVIIYPDGRKIVLRGDEIDQAVKSGEYMQVQQKKEPAAEHPKRTRTKKTK